MNTWIPFGGGVRRCIGAGFSLMEGVAVLREVLTAYDVTATGRGPAQGPQHHERAATRGARSAWADPDLANSGAAEPGGGHNDPMGWGARLRALRMDLGPFREHRDFRLLLIAGTVFYLGGMMTYVAIPFQIYS